MEEKLPLRLVVDSWDSRFFRRKIARVRLAGRPAHFSGRLCRLLIKAKRMRIRLLLLKIAGSNSALENSAGRLGFDFVGQTVDFLCRIRPVKKVPACGGVFVRPCIRKDVSRVRRIAEDAFRLSYLYNCGLADIREIDRYHSVWISNLIKDRKSKVLVATRYSRICGFIAVTPDKSGRNARIALVAVRKDCRGQGIGSMLIDAVFAQAGEKLRTLYVKTQSGNSGAIALYKRSGFNPVCREKIFCKRLG